MRIYRPQLRKETLKLDKGPHFFSSAFSNLTVTSIFLFENGQNPFCCGPSFVPFWSVKYINFGQKLPIRTAHQFFLESRHPEITKNPYCFVPRVQPKKGSGHGLNYVCRFSKRSHPMLNLKLYLGVLF